ncbi:MAG: GMC family oxidoreductase N-terminal domain-containing protein [Spongiibacter sp.]|nr:GMC family oxidoreductase N-terminal domain-containing protein [Spongiibacter sp.]
MRSDFDYIVVGAGSAGCVMANRLSADPSVSVLLIESGPADKSYFIRMPRGIGKLLEPGNAHVWDYQAAAREGARSEMWMKGRTLGGSSSVNGMVYMRGFPQDYDGWQAAGCEGWGWENIHRQYLALENHALGASASRGQGGPLGVTVQPKDNELVAAILAAGEAIGSPTVDDINNLETTRKGGLGYQTRNIWQGQRCSAADVFLKPVRSRKNLHVAVESTVSSIDFDGRRVVGVNVVSKKGATRYSANKEVILCAGAIETPKLLQLSGIGDAELLQSLGISVVHNAPGVGKNLREHCYLAMQYRVRRGSLNSAFQGAGLLRSVVQYIASKTGPMSHAAHEAGGVVKTQPDLDLPDAQIGISLHSLVGDGQRVRLEKEPGLTMGGYFLRPESQGEIRITSADYRQKPYICANYLSSEVDRDHAVSLVKWVRDCVAQAPLRPFIVDEVKPGYHYASDDDILAAFHEMGQTAYHVAGTCRMGSDDSSVVDPKCRVRGVEGLRVVDTSIMPTLVSGNTNAPMMAMAMRAAEIMTEA